MILFKKPKEHGYFTSSYFDSGYFDVLYYDNEYVEKQETDSEIIYRAKNNLNNIKETLKIILITPALAFILECGIIKVCYLNSGVEIADKIKEIYKITCDTYIKNKELDIELKKLELEKLKLNKK